MLPRALSKQLGNRKKNRRVSLYSATEYLQPRRRVLAHFCSIIRFHHEVNSPNLTLTRLEFGVVPKYVKTGWDLIEIIGGNQNGPPLKMWSIRIQNGHCPLSLNDDDGGRAVLGRDLRLGPPTPAVIIVVSSLILQHVFLRESASLWTKNTLLNVSFYCWTSQHLFRRFFYISTRYFLFRLTVHHTIKILLLSLETKSHTDQIVSCFQNCPLRSLKPS